jgi:hypothetical protein
MLGKYNRMAFRDAAVETNSNRTIYEEERECQNSK